MSKIFGVLVFFSSLLGAKAADYDDIFATFYGGISFSSENPVLTGISVGYCPADTIGFGIFFDQSLYPSLSYSSEATFTGVQGSWFLEPFEVSTGLGALMRPTRATELAFLLSGAYLYALAPGMALRFEFHGRASLKRASQAFTTVGLRFLF